MNQLDRFIHWSCLIIGLALLCYFALDAMQDKEPDLLRHIYAPRCPAS